jgi:8-oxo-dGTP pyrophosphatase MutT (NUDIX family)
VSDVHYVVMALLRRGGRVLLCHRSPEREWFPDVWDFPGGHVDPDERPEDALVRELGEELGIAVTAPADAPFGTLEDPDLHGRLWVIDRWVGEPSNRCPDEHDEIGWFTRAEARGLRLVDERAFTLIERALG